MNGVCEKIKDHLEPGVFAVSLIKVCSCSAILCIVKCTIVGLIG